MLPLLLVLTVHVGSFWQPFYPVETGKYFVRRPLRQKSFRRVINQLFPMSRNPHKQRVSAFFNYSQNVTFTNSFVILCLRLYMILYHKRQLTTSTRERWEVNGYSCKWSELLWSGANWKERVWKKFLREEKTGCNPGAWSPIGQLGHGGMEPVWHLEKYI